MLRSKLPHQMSTGAERISRPSMARRTLVECASSYQHPPRVGIAKEAKVAAAPAKVREIAWKAQCRLNRVTESCLGEGRA
jgi:hypothetical protein